DGFVIPIRDVEALQERLTMLYENPDLRRQMGQAARNRAQEFTWEMYGDCLVKEYHHLLDTTRSPSRTEG
ncbi:MAG: glycosyltransferase family 1 protein, partial [Chloroflexi bacterium]